MLQTNFSIDLLAYRVSIFYCYASELAVQEFSYRCLATSLFEGKHDAINFFARRYLLKVSRRTNDAGVDQGLANVLCILVEKAHDLEVKLRPMEKLTNQRNPEGPPTNAENAPLSWQNKIRFTQNQPDAVQQHLNGWTRK